MNIIEKRKKQLMWICLVAILIALLVLAGGVTLVALTGVNFSKLSVVKGVIRIIVGAVMIIMGLFGLVYFVTAKFLQNSVVATDGSIKEGNCCKGTVNMNKCRNCGTEIKGGEDFCSCCGKSTKSKKVCPNCGAECDEDNKHCSKCGADF